MGFREDTLSGGKIANFNAKEGFAALFKRHNFLVGSHTGIAIEHLTG